MILKYGNVTLRPIEKTDSELLQSMLNSPYIETMTGSWNLPALFVKVVVSKIQHFFG